MFRSWLEHPELLQTRLELSLEGQRQPEIAEVSAAWGRELVTIVEDILRRAGHAHATDRADTLTAAMDGVLAREGGRDVLVLDDGTRRVVARLPEALRGRVGARVWLAGPLDGDVESFGVIGGGP